MGQIKYIKDNSEKWTQHTRLGRIYLIWPPPLCLWFAIYWTFKHNFPIPDVFGRQTMVEKNTIPLKTNSLHQVLLEEQERRFMESDVEPREISEVSLTFEFLNWSWIYKVLRSIYTHNDHDRKIWAPTRCCSTWQSNPRPVKRLADLRYPRSERSTPWGLHLCRVPWHRHLESHTLIRWIQYFIKFNYQSQPFMRSWRSLAFS